MTNSMRQIAMEMDASIANASLISLDGLGKLHRWGYDAFQTGVPFRPDVLSLKELGHRHARGLKFLWLNAYLLPDLTLDTPVYSGRVFTGAPARNARAYEIGEAVKRYEYDIVGLCEVFTEESKDRLLSVWGEHTPYWVTGPSEGEANYVVITVETLRSGLLTILPGGYGLLGDSREKFDDEGDRTRDADAWSNKGILKVVADTGYNTKLEVYSTHLIYGGGLSGDISNEDRYEIQRSQLDQLVQFISRERNPSNFLIVAGDFNIYASEGFYGELKWRMENDLGLEDVWTRYAIARYGAKIGQTSDSSLCAFDRLPCERFADDNTSGELNETGRIDYVFVQKPSTQHDISVDVGRPRRVPFQRSATSDSYGDIQYLSDHAGLELQLFVASR